MNQLLLVEDDEEICEIIQFYLLEHTEYSLSIVHSAESALQIIAKRQFDLVLVDVMLPGIDGITFCERLREQYYCPVIFISCISDDETIIRALNVGGDDYLVKPFQAPVLLARIEANLRRASMPVRTQPNVTGLHITLDAEKREVLVDGKRKSLSPTEYTLLIYLMQNPGKSIPYDELYQAVWQRPSLGDLRSLFVHIRHLRQKIEENPSDPKYILTSAHGGYLFTEE